MFSGAARQRGGVFLWLVGLLAIAALLYGGYIWLMLHWSYSAGERAGWVQKLSKKGYLCKTWEGEMAMVAMPGAMPEKFAFTVWDDQVAEAIQSVMGQRVTLHYEEHIGLPTSCFGETRHFVKSVKVVDDGQGPMIVPMIPGRPAKRPAPSPPKSP
jgi:hypothetical protein